MFNSVFKKLTLVYFIVILLSFIILGFSLLNILEDYYFDKKRDALIEEGEKLNSIIIKHLNNQVGYERLELELEAIDRFLNTKIWVVNKDGYVYGVSSKSEKIWIGKQINEEEVIKVLKGHIITKRGKYDELVGSPVLTVGTPIIVNGDVKSAIFMHAPIFEINETLNEVFRLILFSMGISLAIVMIILYMVSQKISKPLSEINEVTKIIASGEFQKRVSIKSKDEIGQLAASFNYMAGELEKIEDNRKTFIANLSHELRSPLTLIKGYIKGIMDMELSEDKETEYLEIIYEETEKLTELIKNLLDLSKMEAGNYPLNKEAFNINEVIRRSIIKYSPGLEGKKVDVQTDFVEEPILVSGDKDSISQILSNLIDNAVKFISEGDKLRFTTKVREEKVYITIEDTGVGISEEELRHIWDRFYKGDKSRSRQVKGTGLGLSIVKEIIKSHQEKIWVESKVGEGTKFTFTLTKAKGGS